MILSSDIYRGVLTGYNMAFIIDDKIRSTLIAQDPKSAEIIKPVLRGRDIQRYQAQWAGLWMIATFPSLHLDINDYPAVKRHLLSYDRERLEQAGKTLADGSKSRKKTPHHWFELQDTCAYHAQFMKEKLFWMHMSPRGRFAYSDSEIYCNQKAFFLTGHSLKYLCAILNSTLVTWLIRNMAVTTGMGLTQWDKFVVERISIPTIAVSEQRQFVQLVESILSAKADSPSADTTYLENEIDGLVYSLYELSTEETVLLDSIEKNHRSAR